LAGPFSLEWSCDTISQNITAFREWTEGRSLRCEIPPVKTKNASQNICETDLSKCLPEEVLSYNNKTSAVSGPNCWNLALVMAKVVPALRYSSDHEMAFFMNSPLCRQLGPSEKKRPGDIGAIRTSKAGQELHGFMWISDDLVFSKNGASSKSPYEVQSFKDLTKTYDEVLDFMCKNGMVKECTSKIETLRCQSMDSYLENKERNTPKKIQEAFIRLEHADKCMSLFNFNPNNFNFTLKKNLIANMQAVAAVFDSPEFKSQLASMPKEEQNFITQSLIFRLDSMHQQMDMSYDSLSLPCATCYFLAREIRKTADSLTPQYGH